MHRIYKKDKFVIYQTTNSGYIVQNILMPGFAHTHIDNFNTAKRVVGLSLSKKVPMDLPYYLLISLSRVNSDEEYLRRINQVMNNRKHKSKYTNQRNLTKKVGD